MYDVIYVFIIFSHTETRYFQLAELRQKCLIYTVILGSLGLFFNEVDGTYLNVKRETRSRSRFPNFAPNVWVQSSGK